MSDELANKTAQLIAESRLRRGVHPESATCGLVQPVHVDAAQKGINEANNRWRQQVSEQGHTGQMGGMSGAEKVQFGSHKPGGQQMN